MASPDVPSLEGCWLKLARANEHFEELKTNLRPALDLIHVTVLTETLYDESAGEFVVQILYAPDLPPRLSIIAGDIVHNLRSALDHLAFQAVWKNTGRPWRRSTFPIVTTPNCYTRGDLVLLRKLGPNFSAIVKRNQPFEDINDYVSEGFAPDVKAAFLLRLDNRPLEVLRQLSNIDKHRLLFPRGARGTNMTYVPSKTVNCDPEPSFHKTEDFLEPGAVLARFRANASGPNPQMEVDFDFVPSAGIGAEGDAQELLNALAVKVLRVIREFEPLF